MVKRKTTEVKTSTHGLEKLFDLEQKIDDDTALLKDCQDLSKYFEEQLSLIKSDQYRNCIASCLNTRIFKYQFEKSTSATGKYHPSYQNGLGGNGRHTKNVVKILQVFERAYPDMMWDAIYAAAILHDSTKYGKEDAPYTDGKHALTSAKGFEDFLKSYIKQQKQIAKVNGVSANVKYLKKFGKMTIKCIKWHDGRFNPLNATKDQIKANYTKKFYKNVKDAECHLMHMADMISASRSLFEEVF